jgi:hypothetical protein
MRHLEGGWGQGVKLLDAQSCGRYPRYLVRSNLMLGNFYFLWVYLTNLKRARITRRPESHLLPYFYHLNSKNLQYSISFSIEHIVLILILNVQYSIFNITNQYRILIKALLATFHACGTDAFRTDSWNSLTMWRLSDGHTFLPDYCWYVVRAWCLVRISCEYCSLDFGFCYWLWWELFWYIQFGVFLLFSWKRVVCGQLR